MELIDVSKKRKITEATKKNYNDLCNSPTFDILTPIEDFSTVYKKKMHIQCKICHTEYLYPYRTIRRKRCCKVCENNIYEKRLCETGYTVIQRSSRILFLKCNIGHPFQVNLYDFLYHDATCPLCKSIYLRAMFQNANKVVDQKSACKYLYCQPMQSACADIWMHNRKLRKYISLSTLCTAVKLLERYIYAFNKRHTEKVFINNPKSIIAIILTLTKPMTNGFAADLIGIHSQNRAESKSKLFPKKKYKMPDIKRNFIFAIHETENAEICDFMQSLL